MWICGENKLKDPILPDESREECPRCHISTSNGLWSVAITNQSKDVGYVCCQCLVEIQKEKIN